MQTTLKQNASHSLIVTEFDFHRVEIHWFLDNLVILGKLRKETEILIKHRGESGKILDKERKARAAFVLVLRCLV